MPIDPRFLAESGPEVFTGNELLVKGALETEGGVHLLTGYPGSPVAGFFDVCGDIAPLLKQHGVRAFQANNEALGVAALNGSQMAPCRGIATTSVFLVFPEIAQYDKRVAGLPISVSVQC